VINLEKIKLSAISVVLSATLTLGMSSAIDEPMNIPSENPYSDGIEIGTTAERFDMLEKVKIAEEERIYQEELKRQEEERQLASRSEQKTYLGEFNVSFYCSCSRCCGKANKPCANGEYPVEGVTVAADTSKYPFGTKFYIDGLGDRIVMDTGSAIKGNKLDVYVSDHQRALELGRRKLSVWKY